MKPTLKPHELYKQAKDELEAERLLQDAKAKGLFTKYEVHDLIGSALSQFLIDLQGSDPFTVGIGVNALPLSNLVNRFQDTYNLRPDQIDWSWAEKIKKDV